MVFNNFWEGYLGLFKEGTFVTLCQNEVEEEGDDSVYKSHSSLKVVSVFWFNDIWENSGALSIFLSFFVNTLFQGFNILLGVCWHNGIGTTLLKFIGKAT